MKPLLVSIWSDGFHASWQRKAVRSTLFLVLFFFPFSLLFVGGRMLPPEFSWTASVVLFLYGAATLLSELRMFPPGVVLVTFLVLAGVLFVVELIGVRTGIPFGNYEYTKNLGFAVAGVPLAISIAWYTSIMNSWRIAGFVLKGNRRSSVLLIATAAGMMTLMMDVLLEPMAGWVTEYWIWKEGRVPLQNYASWFVLSVVAVAILEKGIGKTAPSLGMFVNALLLFGLQCTLFAVTNLLHGAVLAVLVAMALLVAGMVLSSTVIHSFHGGRTRG